MAPIPESQGLSGTAAHSASEEEQFRTILEGPSFQKAPAVRSLLLYLWRTRGQPLSEYAVATEALGRKPDFDPRVDATVRVHIARLRQKLKEFYETDGRFLDLRISIPLGGHQLDVQVIRHDEAMPAVTDVGSVKPPDWSQKALAIGCAILLIACLAQYSQNRRLAAQIQGKSSLPRFWETFFANGKKTNLFLPTPVFFEWAATNLKLRDPQVNEFIDFENSTELKRYTSQWGSPKLLQNYTVASDTFAALKLIQFAQDHGIALGFGGTADFSLESQATQNIILLGTPGITSRHLKKVMEATNFYYLGTNGSTVLNRNPRPGEAARYDEVIESDRRRTALGIIALLPGKGSGTLLLTLTGRFTSPLASFLISPQSLEQFEAIWQKEESPPHFELLVQVELDGDTVLKRAPLAMRPLHITY